MPTTVSNDAAIFGQRALNATDQEKARVRWMPSADDREPDERQVRMKNGVAAATMARS